MIDLLILQTTTFCNIDCRYCYLTERGLKKRMSVAVLEKTLNNALADGLVSNQLTLVWHAGEPLAVGCEHFEQLLACCSSVLDGINFTHSIQTNGMLINDAWCDLFKRYNCQIGISIDGPQFINDAARVRRNGKSTFADTMNGVAYLQKHKIPYHSIAVVSSLSLDHPDEIFSFFHQNGFHKLCLNIEEVEGTNQNSSIYFSENNAKISAFYKRMFDLYAESDKHMSLRELDSTIHVLLRGIDTIDITQLVTNSHQLIPWAIITVDTAGNFCTFSPELLGQESKEFSNFILGNVHEIGFKDAQKTELFKRLYGSIEEGINKCKSNCEYYHVCGGGAPANKYYENGTFSSTETMFCKYSVQIPVNVVLEHLENELLVQ